MLLFTTTFLQVRETPIDGVLLSVDLAAYSLWLAAALIPETSIDGVLLSVGLAACSLRLAASLRLP